MGAALAAARLGDPIEHSSAMMGFLLGAAVGLAVGVAIVAATVATGGAALAVVAAVGAGIATTGGMALVGEKLGHTFTSQSGKIVAICSPNVFINGKPAAVAMRDEGQCSKHGPMPVRIAQGSGTVFINGFPAARVGDRLQCDGKIADGSPDVFIGGEPVTYLEIEGEVPAWMNNFALGMVYVGGAMALGFGAAAAWAAGGMCALIGFGAQTVGGLVGGLVGAGIGGAIGQAVGGERGEIIGETIGGIVGGFVGAGIGGRMTAGHPVDVATGELFTRETDFRIFGVLPLVWTRLWISSSSINGSLGCGWHHSYDMALGYSPANGHYVARLADGRLALFNPPMAGQPSLNSVERLLLHTDGARFWLLDYDGITYEFGAPGSDGLLHLVRVIDPNGNAIKLERDAAGVLYAMVDSAGRAYSVTRDYYGRILAIDAPHPDGDGQTLRLVSYKYDGAGDLIEARDARGNAFRYSYNNHLLTEEHRRGGLTFHFVWDNTVRGRKARCVDSWGNGGLFRAKLDYDVANHRTMVTTGRGAVTHYRWNALGLVEEEINPLGAVWLREYDAGGRLLLTVGPQGEKTANEYDELGRLVKRTNAAGEATEIEYVLTGIEGICHGNPALIIGPDGAVHRFVYDTNGNLSGHIDPTGVQRYFARDARGLPVQMTDGERIWRRWIWSADGNLIAEGTESGIRVRYGHDRLGRVIAVQRGEDAPDGLVRDAKGNLIEIHRPDGGVIRLDYDAEDRVIRHRDPLGRETRWRYDGLRYPVERIAADGSRFVYEYDSELNLIGLENPKGERYRLDYDLAGRLVREKGFDDRVLDYKYDDSGRLLEQLDAGRPTKFVRDPLGRLLEKIFADGNSHRFAWDRASRLTLAENADRRVELGYDQAGRVLHETQDKQMLVHRYDHRGRRVETMLPDGRKLQIAFGDEDLFSIIFFGGPAVAAVKRDKVGREVERVAGNIWQSQKYDPQGRLVLQEGFSRDANEHPVFARRYGYDASDALKILEDMHQGLKLYQYDACDRLVAVDGMNPEHFVVDPAGNILGSSSERNPESGDARGDRLLSFNGRNLSYDEHGNRVYESDSKSGVEIANRYDFQNQLVEVAKTDKYGVHVTQFGYDALARRIWKESLTAGTMEQAQATLERKSRAVKRTEFLWNGNVLLAESEDKADPLQVVYLFEPGTFRPLAQVRRKHAYAFEETYHYHLDHLGTPKEMTNTRGEVVWAADLKAWGAVRVRFVSRVPNPFRFQGQYHDEETGLHYNRFRYYSPDEGCFIHQDPVRLHGGMNVAAYAPNPVKWVDPFGLTSTWSPGSAAANGYPGVGVTPSGGPDFAGTPYLYPATGDQQNIVQIQMQGTRNRDFTQAYQESGISRSDAEGYTWHHVDDFDPATGKSTMQLVSKEAHEATYSHEGSVKQFSDEYGVRYDTQDAVKVSEEKGWLQGPPCKL